MDGVVSNVEELNDLGLRKLLDDAFAGGEFLLELAGVLDKQLVLQ